jgi:hypothetical protein
MPGERNPPRHPELLPPRMQVTIGAFTWGVKDSLIAMRELGYHWGTSQTSVLQKLSPSGRESDE